MSESVGKLLEHVAEMLFRHGRYALQENVDGGIGVLEIAERCAAGRNEIERLESLREREWLPIETAPRDGRRVELWVDYDTYEQAEFGRWDAEKYHPDWVDDYGDHIKAKHWRTEPKGTK